MASPVRRGPKVSRRSGCGPHRPSWVPCILSHWQLRQCELAALHSGETADLGGSLGPDAQTVTALAPCQGLPGLAFHAMVSLGHRRGSLAFGSGLPLSPVATLPLCGAVPQEPKGQASWIAYGGVWVPVFSASGVGGGARQPGDFHHGSQATSLFSFHLQNASILLPSDMQMLNSRLLALESTSKQLPVPRILPPFVLQTGHRLGKAA